MLFYQGKKKKLTIKYKDHISNIDIEPYETISHLISLILRIYPEINSKDYYISYQSKELMKIDNVNLRIDEFFKGKKNSIIEITKKEKNNDEIDLNKINEKCKCNNTIISYFCRKCNCFICSNCKKLYHSEHNTIPIEIDNILENIKFYSIELQNEINESLTKYKEIENMFKNNVLIDFFSLKEIIIRKLETIEQVMNKFEEFKSIFQKKYETIEKMAFDLSNKINKNINEISWNLLNNKKVKSEITYKEIKNYFQNLNSHESLISIMKNEVNSRKDEFETNKKINQIFNDLDKIFEQMEELSNKSNEIIKEKIEESNKKINKNQILHLSQSIELNDVINNNNNKIKKKKSYVDSFNILKYQNEIIGNNIKNVNKNFRNDLDKKNINALLISERNYSPRNSFDTERSHKIIKLPYIHSQILKTINNK